jgi:hypothetical protein
MDKQSSLELASMFDRHAHRLPGRCHATGRPLSATARVLAPASGRCAKVEMTAAKGRIEAGKSDNLRGPKG